MFCADADKHGVESAHTKASVEAVGKSDDRARHAVCDKTLSVTLSKLLNYTFSNNETLSVQQAKGILPCSSHHAQVAENSHSKKKPHITVLSMLS